MWKMPNISARKLSSVGALPALSQDLISPGERFLRWRLIWTQKRRRWMSILPLNPISTRARRRRYSQSTVRGDPSTPTNCAPQVIAGRQDVMAIGTTEISSAL